MSRFVRKAGYFHWCHECGDNTEEYRSPTGWYTRGNETGNVMSYRTEVRWANLYRCEGCGHEFCSKHIRQVDHSCPNSNDTSKD